MADKDVSSPRSAYALVLRRALPVHLDGSTGTNRGTGRQQIDANRDLDAIDAWLAQFKSQPATYAAYEKEVSRFYVWVVLTLQKPLSSLVHEEWQVYKAFLRDPQPAEIWVGRAKRPRLGRDGRVSDTYRPFAGPLSEKSITFSERAIWQMFDWLRNAGYLAGNPLIALSKQRRPLNSQRVTTRILTDEQWLRVLQWLAQHPRDNILARRTYARLRWMVALFYSTGLRSSEAISARMGDILSLRDPTTGKLRTFIQVVGKGSKARDVPLTDEVLAELQLYRRSFCLAAMPVSNEDIPLVFSVQIKSGFRPITRQALYTIFKNMFDSVACTLESTDPLGAKHLRAASTHWLRHMAASTMLHNGTPLLVVRDVLGHKDLSTTSIYSHAQTLDMHRELEAHNHLDLHQPKT